MNSLQAQEAHEGPSSTAALINSSGEEKEPYLDMKTPLIKRLAVKSRDCQSGSRDGLIFFLIGGSYFCVEN